MLVYAIFGLLNADMHFKRDCRGKKQVERPLSTRSISESEKTHENAAMARWTSGSIGPSLIWLLQHA
jgi:hypothetical protein